MRSITDTSYFPTDELEQVPEVPSGAETGPDAKKDLAFLGYTYVLPPYGWDCGCEEGRWPGGSCVEREVRLIYRFRRYEML